MLLIYLLRDANYYSLAHLFSKDVITIMDEDPAQSPSRNKPAFSQTTTGQNGYITAKRSQGMKLTVGKDLRKFRTTSEMCDAMHNA